jgi:hypothetical protein
VVYNVGQGWTLKEAKRMRKGFSFLVGLFAGAVVGAIAGILLAPYSGPELQEQVRTRLQGLIEEGKRAAAARRAEMEAQLEDFKRGPPVTLEPPPEEA